MRPHQLVYDGETCNIWLIEWPSGTGLDWHHHGDSNCEIIVLEGILFEEVRFKYRTEHWSRFWYAGQKYQTEADVLHRVTNEQMKKAVTLHMYSPPLTVEYPEALEIG